MKKAWHNQNSCHLHPWGNFIQNSQFAMCVKASWVKSKQQDWLQKQHYLHVRKFTLHSLRLPIIHLFGWACQLGSLDRSPLTSCEESTGCPRYCPRALQCVHSPGWGKETRDERARKKGLEKQCYGLRVLLDEDIKEVNLTLSLSQYSCTEM